MKLFFLSLVLVLIVALAYFVRPTQMVYADKINPQSSNYIMEDFGFGAGGTASSSSTTYSLFGMVGQTDVASLSSQNYRLGNGLTYTQVASVPAAPTFTNPSSYYNKLLITVNPGQNPSDYTYAIAVSSDNFASDVEYIESDNTLGTTFSVLNYRTYTNWNGASGTTIVGLQPGVTYTAKVSARQGFYTQSPFGPTAQATTSNPTFSFSVSPNSVSLGSIAPGTIGSSPTITATTTTNGAGGVVVYVNDANSGLSSQSTSYTITAVSSDLSSSLEGYGLQGQSVGQSSGGPMEILSPYNGSGNVVGTLSTVKQGLFDSSGQPVTSGTGTFLLQAKPSTTAKAATDYSDTITVVGAAVF